MVIVDRGARAVASNPYVPSSAPQHVGWVTLTPLVNPGAAVRLEMVSGVTRTGGQAVWDEIDRPKRQNAIGFTGISLREQTFNVLLEGDSSDASEPASVQPLLAAMLALTVPLPGQAEPPLLNLDGPVWGRRGAMQWVLRSAEPVGEERRRSAEGYVWQVEFKLTLTEYVPVDVLAQLVAPVVSPAAQAVAAQKVPGAATSATTTTTRTYTVARGDTLQRIAQRELGSASRWRDIASLNSIANANLIQPGQKLKLP